MSDPGAPSEQEKAEHDDALDGVELPPTERVSPFAPEPGAPPPPRPADGGRSAAGKRAARAALFPLLRVIEPRFADTNRRLDDTRRSLHEESNLTRWVMERDLVRLEDGLANYQESASETLAFVGLQMRELQDEVRSLSAQVAALEARLAAGDAQ